MVKRDECYQIRIGILQKTVKVIDSPKQRVGAPLVNQYFEDLTPSEEYENLKTLRAKFEHRDHGSGRQPKEIEGQNEFLRIFYPSEE
jgi:hypothetical protein